MNEIQVLDFKSQKLITVNQSTKQKSGPQVRLNSPNGKSRLIPSFTDQTKGALEYLKAVKLFIVDHLRYAVSVGIFLIALVFLSSCRIEKSA